MEEIILQVPHLDPRFSIFIDLCWCDFQAVESFTVQVCLNSFKKKNALYVINTDVIAMSPRRIED